MPLRVGEGRKPGTTEVTSLPSKDTAGGKPVSILKGKQDKRKTPVPEETAAVTAAVGTPKDWGISKAAQPQGTSPMAQDKAQEDDLDIRLLDLNLDDDKDASVTDDDQDSIAKAISSTRKELFGSAKGRAIEGKVNKGATETVRCTKTWRPIIPRDTPAQAEGGGKGATFSAETIFHEQSLTPTDRAKIASKHHECVVGMHFKLQPCDVQETLVGLLAHCLAVLQERDKSACILNRQKSLEAKRVSDLPCNFMDFYNKWGLWEEDI
jgi:hypothetical protein